MSSKNLLSEYLNCFHSNEELSSSEPTEIEELQQDFQQKEKMVAPVKTEKAAKAGKVRGNYRSTQQTQELLGLVIEQGLSAKQADLFVGIAQHYMNLYKDDEEKHLSCVAKAKSGGLSKKLEPRHTAFLRDFYRKNAAAVLREARDALLSAFPDIDSIALSSLHYYLTKHASLTLKKLVKARSADDTLEQRKEKVLEWKADKELGWEKIAFSSMRQILTCILYVISGDLRETSLPKLSFQTIEA
ncbi:hypothetical protein EDC96DRAFT_545942 [Choanephora cucurbitarum]|nr:hypothetical protein EDC96DRAFT_545942 [Choanephora cucurbitarum]